MADPVPAQPAELKDFTVDFMSDIHADAWDGEEYDYAAHKKSDIAVIAGDLADGPQRALAELKKIAAVYPTVLYVDGNHEFRDEKDHLYHFNFAAVEKELHDGIEKIPNVVYLKDKPFIKDGVAIIGRNGHWDYAMATGDPMVPDIAAMKDAASAFKSSFLNASRFINMARRDFYALRDQVMALDKDPSIHSIVVVSHTVPRKDLLIEKLPVEWQGRAGAAIMKCLKKYDKHNKMKFWLYAHQHTPAPLKIVDGVTYFENPRGLKREGNITWKPAVVKL
jgi:hypothetical protein